MSKQNGTVANVAAAGLIVWGVIEWATLPVEVGSMSMEPGLSPWAAMGFVFLGIGLFFGLFQKVSSNAHGVGALCALLGVVCLVIGYSKGGDRKQETVAGESQSAVAVQEGISWDRTECLRRVGELKSMHGDRWKAYVTREMKKHCSRELVEGDVTARSSAPQDSRAPEDPTYCLNQISRLRSLYGESWRRWVSAELLGACRREIESATPSGGAQPRAPSFANGDVQPLEMSEPERRRYCLELVELSKQRFGLSWISHIHAVRKSDCRQEIGEAIQADRDRCRWTTGCDLSQLPTMQDVYR